MPDPTHTLTTEPLALRVEAENGAFVRIASVVDPKIFTVAIGEPGCVYANAIIPAPALLAFARAVVERGGFLVMPTEPTKEMIEAVAIEVSSYDYNFESAQDSAERAIEALVDSLPKAPQR